MLILDPSHYLSGQSGLTGKQLSRAGERFPRSREKEGSASPGHDDTGHVRPSPQTAPPPYTDGNGLLKKTGVWKINLKRYILLYSNMLCCCLVTHSYPTLCNPVDCSPPGFSVHGDSPARILEWVAMPSSRGSSQPRDWTHISHIAGSFFTSWATREAFYVHSNTILNSQDIRSNLNVHQQMNG